MDFALPPVGEGLIEVELIRWLVGGGDKVKRGQPLMEVMSDKATMEVPSAFTGTVTETLAEPGAKIQVGHPVMRYTPPADAARSKPSRIGMKLPLVRGRVVRGDEPGWRAASERPVHGDRPADRSPAPWPPPRRCGTWRGSWASISARVRGTGPGGRVLLDDLAFNSSGTVRQIIRRGEEGRTTGRRSTWASQAPAPSSSACGGRSPSTWWRARSTSRTTPTSTSAT